LPPFEQLARTCMHPSGFTDDVKGVKKSSQGKKIIKEMFTYVWPKDNPEIKARVVLAVSLLLGAKVFVYKGTDFSMCCYVAHFS